MKTSLEIHRAQAQILKELLLKPSARFRDLNVTGLTTDHFTFHLRQLVESELIIKDRKGRYQLTATGKEFANRFDTQTVNLERQAKLAVLIVGIKKDQKSVKYLIQQRLKQPYYGYRGFVTGKVRWGETLPEAAQREFAEETGLRGKFTFVGLRHKIDYSTAGLLLEDKFFMVFRADRLEGNFRKNFEGGRNQWFSEKEIQKLPKLFPDVKITLRFIQGQTLRFHEKKYRVSTY
jgi:8-oxo-dGTP pyrophosphatase MutT (NUDIX family)/predicted transcriptional regulator